MNYKGITGRIGSIAGWEMIAVRRRICAPVVACGVIATIANVALGANEQRGLDPSEDDISRPARLLLGPQPTGSIQSAPNAAPAPIRHGVFPLERFTGPVSARSFRRRAAHPCRPSLRRASNKSKPYRHPLSWSNLRSAYLASSFMPPTLMRSSSRRRRVI
jgi:hypothetical protein